MKQTEYSSWKNWDRAPASIHEWKVGILTNYSCVFPMSKRIVESDIGERRKIFPSFSLNAHTIQLDIRLKAEGSTFWVICPESSEFGQVYV